MIWEISIERFVEKKNEAETNDDGQAYISSPDCGRFLDWTVVRSLYPACLGHFPGFHSYLSLFWPAWIGHSILPLFSLSIFSLFFDTRSVCSFVRMWFEKDGAERNHMDVYAWKKTRLKVVFIVGILAPGGFLDWIVCTLL